MKQFKILFLTLIFMLTATASMGNTVPVADAGEDQTVGSESRVKLDGTASYDGDGDRLKYSWGITIRPSGSTASFSNPSGKKPNFKADVDGNYTIELTVTDGIESDSNTTTIHVGLHTAASTELDLATDLNESVWETSGLANVNGKLYTHNDSGNSNLLYEINASTGDVIRSIIVNGSANVDWEDLASDDTHLYIADIGNNLGDRNNLVIYKILKSDFDDENNEVDAETIAFSYADQITFDYPPTTTVPPLPTTPYDAEALIAFKGKLYVFTKNWVDNTSKIYKIPTKPGIYEVDPIAEKTLAVMVTGADIDDTGSSLALVGYPKDPFTSKSMIIKLSGFTRDNFFSGGIAQHEIDNTLAVGQVEAILFNTPTEFYLSAEGITVPTDPVVEIPPKLFTTEITK